MTRVLLFISRWINQSGDTTFWSWVITFFYAVTIITSLYYLYKLKGENTREKRFLWYCIVVFLIIMGINKQLDLQIFLTMSGRFIARHIGWFERRRIIQAYFTIGIILFFSSTGIYILYKIRTIIRQSLVELAGATTLLFFAVIRAASFNHIGFAVSFENHTISRIHGLEMTGLVLILCACVYNLIFSIRKT